MVRFTNSSYLISKIKKEFTINNIYHYYYKEIYFVVIGVDLLNPNIIHNKLISLNEY